MLQKEKQIKISDRLSSLREKLLDECEHKGVVDMDSYKFGCSQKRTYCEVVIMDAKEKAKIVAMARLLGIEGSDAEIIEKYSEAYNKAYVAFSSEPAEPVKGEVFKRPW